MKTLAAAKVTRHLSFYYSPSAWPNGSVGQQMNFKLYLEFVLSRFHKLTSSHKLELTLKSQP